VPGDGKKPILVFEQGTRATVEQVAGSARGQMIPYQDGGEQSAGDRHFQLGGSQRGDTKGPTLQESKRALT